MPLSIILIVFAAWRLKRREPGSRRATVFWPAVLFGAALLQQSLQRPDTTHLAWVTGVTFPGDRGGGGAARRACAEAHTASAFRGCNVIDGGDPRCCHPLLPGAQLHRHGRTDLRYQPLRSPITNDGRVFPFRSPEAAADAQAVVDEPDRLADPGDSLITGPTDPVPTNYNDSFFYHLFPELEVGTRYIEMDPGLADVEGSGLAQEVAEADWLILSNSAAAWTEPNESAESRSQDANEVVAEVFCPALVTDSFELWGRCDRLER
ncbi:MAG: hypothetical protein M5U19_11165 [Microthrixaceae bacterium]|nr:hypothetical protein [Microthrixaceae bacterium]